MSKRWHDDKPQPKASTICGRCRGTGTETRQRQRRTTDAAGKPVTVTEDHEETCRMCNGYAEYPTI